MARSRIGFLTSGSGGNPTGIGNYVAQLSQAGIPAVIACNDGDVGIGDALNTNIDHVLLFRVVVNNTEEWSVPDYSLPPIQAAQKHWDKIKTKFNPNIVAHKDRVWIQPINEVDKNRSDWLGYFGVGIAKIADYEGFKVALFAFSSGEPEPADWRTSGMIAYLNYCQSNPGQACIALHEYDYGQQGMANVYPYHIGRFQELYRACDELQITYPEIIISEFGWSYNSIPEQNKAIADVAFAAELYAKYNEVLGATIWYLGPGFSNIADKVQKLIEPVTIYTLNTEFPDPEEPPMPDCKGLPRIQYHRTVLLLPPSTISADWITAAAEATMSERWTLMYSADDAGIGDLNEKDVIAVNPGAWANGDETALQDFFNDFYPGTGYMAINATSSADLKAKLLALLGGELPSPF